MLIEVLEESKSIARSYSIELKAILDVYRNIFNISFAQRAILGKRLEKLIG